MNTTKTVATTPAERTAAIALEDTDIQARAREIAEGLARAFRDEAARGWVGRERGMLEQIARDIEECRGDLGRAVAAVLAEGTVGK